MFCEYCAKESIELNNCSKCDLKICYDCQAPYNQFTQIDYDCCLDCSDGYSNSSKKLLASRRNKLKTIKKSS